MIKQYLFTVWLWADGLNYIEWAGLMLHWMFFVV